MTEKVNIFLASNEKYAPFLYATINSIVYHTQQLDRLSFYILSRDLSELTKGKIIKLTGGRVEFIDVEMTLMNSFPQMTQFPYLSAETYLRYLVPNIKPDLDRALYLDSDLIFKEDICNLWENDLDGFPLGACQEMFYFALVSWKKKLGIKGYYFNAGVMILDLKKLREHKTVERLCKLTFEIGDKVLFADQDIFNVIFDGNFKILPIRFNVTYPIFYKNPFQNEPPPDFAYSVNEIQQAAQLPAVIHYSGPNKANDPKCIHPLKNEWFKYAEH
jgi:lipopolysaccharide biosynthesis glycosyltransferase